MAQPEEEDQQCGHQRQAETQHRSGEAKEADIQTGHQNHQTHRSSREEQSLGQLSAGVQTLSGKQAQQNQGHYRVARQVQQASDVPA